MNASTVTGNAGEEYVARYLAGKGYSIVERNFRCRTGEIDIIAADRENILFVEVKTRKNGSFAAAVEYVGRQKQRSIISAARYWLLLHRSELQPRFDVAEVYYGGYGSPELTYIEDAFET